MRSAWILPKRKEPEANIGNQPTAVADRKITEDDYRTLWRRSQETYVPVGIQYEPEESSNQEKTHLEKKRAIEDIIALRPRSRIISVSDLRFEEKRVVSPLASMRLLVGNPLWSDIEYELETRNFYISPEAKRIISLNKDRIVELKELELLLFKVKDISPEKVSSPASFFAQAEFYGYGQCPMEIGAYSRLTIQQQNPGDEFCIGMEPINDSSNSPIMFSIKQTGKYEGTRRGLVVVKADSGYHGGFSPENRILLRKLS